MFDFFESIIFGFNAILKWEIAKIALISSLLTSVILVIFGVIFWNPLVSIVSFMLELVPFSLVRSNGAEIVSIFVWMQVVLITFALIVVLSGVFLYKKMSQREYSYFYIISLICSILFWALIWFFKGNYLHVELLKLLNWLPFETIDKSMSYMIACLIIYNLIIVFSLFVASILSQKVLFEINREYFDNDVVYSKELNIFRYTIKDTAIFFLLSIVLFPLFFIPILNWIVQIGLWTYLVRNTFRYDVSAVLFGDINEERLKKTNIAIWSISFISAIFNFIPFINIFGSFFGEISMFHYLKNFKE